ncbi:alpha-ketoglutarate-dependent 2,4-dichlorophenoxyacetate dioxygenase [Sistotremastrum niveocremeum HHB9708]|uniref:Alpha-ketoglutarate-dependent 2,4-dichlorophenoxyacetate dioxygenase n=1 Tax=Sistotremastrum niveocremeum HHB9708 TaxID=1314777 RepID=A0A164XDH0_9AGAM|nr:alpha-ketoglutarate-dependent 2,4-dichlorophenoxyacetate dioxygenase [Sistotremastrum niveocremeum HHB9708]
MEPIRIGSLTCQPLHPTFVAEITGVDFSKPIPDDQICDIIAAQDRFGVTVYRNTSLDDQRHIALSRQLGKLEQVPKFNGPKVPDRFGFPELFDAGNTDREGKIIQKDSRRWWYNKGNTLWHTDSSFNQHRSKYSLLLAHQIPNEGGDTEFADMRNAYRAFPEVRKRQLRGLIAEHDLWHSRKLAAPQEYSAVTDFERAAKPPAYHKLVQIASDGGETLYVAAHASRILGKPEQEGLRLIGELIEDCTQAGWTHAVKWKQVGDLVNNRIVMHRGRPFSDQMEVRDMRRTTVFDDGPGSLGAV